MLFPVITAAALLIAVSGSPPPTDLPGAAGDTTGACVEDLERLARKVEANYAGYHLEVTGTARDAYRERLARLRNSAAGVSGDECFFVLRDYVEGFADPHLFVFQSVRLDTAETSRRAAAVRMTTVTETDARRYFASRGSALDPIEGIWFDRGLRVAILPDTEGQPGTFMAVVLTPDSSTWRPGAVRARITKSRGGGYDAQVWERNHAWRHLRARIHRSRLLRMSPVIWGKEFPIAPGDSGQLDPVNPRQPTLLVRDSTVLVSVPSHDPAYRRTLDSLVAAHRTDLERAHHLIIDLRGNEGGSSGTTAALLPYVGSDSQLPSVLPDAEPMMLASEDQIAYATRYFAGPAGPDSSPRLQALLTRMRAHPGELVSLLDSGESVPEAPRPSPIMGPRRVGVIVDGGTVSAAEVLVATAMRSTRATVFGEPTEGALDYQSTYIVPFQKTGRRWLLGYPTITAHRQLPARGIRGRGIAPHVRLELDRLEDVVSYVDSLLTNDRENTSSR